MALDKDTASPTGIMNPADYLKEEPKKTKKQTEKERQAQEKDKEHAKQALERTEAIAQERQKQERVAQQRQDRIAKENAQEEKIKTELSGAVDDYMNKQEGLANAKRLNTTGVSGASHLAPKMSYNMELSDPLSNKLKAGAAANPKINLPSYTDKMLDFANIKDTPITFDASKVFGSAAQENVQPEQENVPTTEQAKNVDSSPTGIENPASYLDKVGTEWNKQGFMDKSYGRGDKFNKNTAVIKEAGKRTSKEQDQWGNPLPDNAYEYVEQMLNMERAKGNVNKDTLEYIELAAKVYYTVPKNWDISASGITMTNRQMSKVMNNMPYNNPAQAKQSVKKQPEPKSAEAAKPVETKPATQKPATQKPATQKPVTQKQAEKPKGTQVGNTNKAVANAKPGDFLVRSNGDTVILKQGDIDNAKRIVSTPAQPAQPVKQLPTRVQNLMANNESYKLKKAKQQLDGYTKALKYWEEKKSSDERDWQIARIKDELAEAQAKYNKILGIDAVSGAATKAK